MGRVWLGLSFAFCCTVPLSTLKVYSPMLLLPFLLFVSDLEALFPHPFLRRHLRIFPLVLMGLFLSHRSCQCGIYSQVCSAVLPDMYPCNMTLHSTCRPSLCTHTPVLILFITHPSADGGFCLTQDVHTKRHKSLPCASSLTLCPALLADEMFAAHPFQTYP